MSSDHSSDLRLSDAVWNRLAETDPYWGVLSMQEFRGDLAPDVRQRFFATGEAAVGYAISQVRTVDPHFAPKTGIDFGCGVGRLTRALAGRLDHVTAVDISPTMLDLCRRNCAEVGRTNIDFVLSDDRLSGLGDRKVDFVMSSITFQHIREDRGLLILEQLLSHLAPGGGAALFLLISGSSVLMQGSAQEVREDAERLIEMNVYSSERVLRLLSRYTRSAKVSFVPTGGQLGADIYVVRDL